MTAEKPSLGILGKLAAAAAALTAILTFVFLLFPNLKPSPDAEPSKPMAASVGAEGAAVIRGILVADHAATAAEAYALAPLDRDPPSANARPEEQARYLIALSESYKVGARALEDRIAVMERFPLAPTPIAFRQAMQGYLKALRNIHQVLMNAHMRTTRAALDTRTAGSSAYREFMSAGLADLAQQAASHDTAAAQAWADVKAAALSVGIE